jgi:hypothetical protein
MYGNLFCCDGWWDRYCQIRSGHSQFSRPNLHPKLNLKYRKLSANSLHVGQYTENNVDSLLKKYSHEIEVSGKLFHWIYCTVYCVLCKQSWAKRYSCIVINILLFLKLEKLYSLVDTALIPINIIFILDFRTNKSRKDSVILFIYCFPLQLVSIKLLFEIISGVFLLALESGYVL